MSAEINLAQIIKYLPEIKSSLIQHRRWIFIPAATVLAYILLKDSIQDYRDHYFMRLYLDFLPGERELCKIILVGN